VVFLRAFGPAEGLQDMLVGYGLAGVLALVPVSPGGLGIVEGTLVSLLVGFGTSHAQAVLGVITWRLAEFWLPIPLAALTYLSLRTGTLRHHRLPARPVIPVWQQGSATTPRTASDAVLSGAPTPEPHRSDQRGRHGPSAEGNRLTAGAKPALHEGSEPEPEPEPEPGRDSGAEQPPEP
jgi:hypothetical protein